MWRSVLRYAVVLGGLCNAACDGCTLIGCADPLRVEVRDAAGNPVSEFSGEAHFEGRAVAFACTRDGAVGTPPLEYSCTHGAVWFTARPPSLELFVEGADGTRARVAAAPHYVHSFPNGDECGPACENAVVTARLE